MRGKATSHAEDLVSFLSSPNPLHRAAGLSPADYCDVLVNELKERIVAIGADRIAAFIAEPVLASGGVIVPPEGYFARMGADRTVNRKRMHHHPSKVLS